MKKGLIITFFCVIFVHSIICQEERFFETAWETNLKGVNHIILLKDMLWIRYEGFDDIYMSSDIVYNDGKILSKVDLSLLFQYEIHEENLLLISPNNSIFFKQIPISNDITTKTKFQGNWVTENETGKMEVYIFYGNFVLLQSHRNSEVMVIRFSYTEEQIISSFGGSWGVEIINYTNYILYENKLKLFIDGKEHIYYRVTSW